MLDGNEFKVSMNGGVSFSGVFSFSLSGSVHVVARPGEAGEVWVCGGMKERERRGEREIAKRKNNKNRQLRKK